MKILNKLTVTLLPDTIQSSFQGVGELKLSVETLKFNDGSIRVVIPEMEKTNHRYCVVDSFMEGMDDLMIVAQIKDIISRFCNCSFILNILSTPYTRYDRVMFPNGTDAFGAKVFAEMVKATGYDFVNFFDCHSDVMLKEVKANGFSQEMCLDATIKNINEYNLIAPDKGAVVKNPNAVIICDKVRDVETGRITGLKIISNTLNDCKSKFLVVDDICEGGRTFIEFAKLFHREVNLNADLELYVTHGIFSNNAIEKLFHHYTKIHVYIMKKSLYDSLNDLDKTKLNINILIDD